MIFSAALFYVLLILLSVMFTKDKYNMFIISNVVFLTTTFLFPFLGELYGLENITSVKGVIMYIFYFLVFFVFYLYGRRSVKLTPISIVPDYTGNIYIYIVLVFSLFINLLFIAYSVGAYGIDGAFIHPREVYSVTRTGTGQIYLVAAVFFNLYIFLGLFVFKRKWLHFIICVIFALPYGTKGKIFLLVIYNFVYFLFVSRGKLRLRKPQYFIIMAASVPLIMFGAFWYTSIGLESNEILKFAIGYGMEYENNFHELVNHFHTYFPHGYLNGQVFFGNSFYPFIPRILWAGKPFYFGDLYISYIVFPDATQGNTGAPSFGPIGQPYADFGFWGGMIQIFIEQAIVGYLLGRFEIKCLNNPTIKNFLILITIGFGGLVVVTGPDKLLLIVINIIFISIVFWPLKYNFKLKATPADGVANPG